MSIETLKEKATSYKILQEYLDSKEKGRLEFLAKFPIDKLSKMTLDEYVLGTGKESFCYWLEFKKIEDKVIVFGIGGGNASKFGLYKSKDGLYQTGFGENKKAISDKELDDYFNSIKSAIIRALKCVEEDRIKDIKKINIPFGNMILQKILSIYYPDKFITIGASNVLIDFAKDIKLQNIELTPNNLIEINYECKRGIDKLSEFQNWPYEKIGTFIWENYRPIEEEKNTDSKIKYWLYSPGENAELWDEFYSNGIMGLGWDELGDLNDYKSKKELIAKLQELEKTTGSKKNDSTANYEFKDGISLGDIIIAKKGRGELLGYGVVKSEYFYDKERSRFQKCRKIDWKIKGNWKTDHSLALKTLTDITKYSSELPDYKTYSERLLGIMGIENKSKDYREEFSNWLNLKYENNSEITSIYVKAIDILSKILSKELFKTTNDRFLIDLYSDIIKEQENKNGKYFQQDAPSYGSNGFYAASIKSYREFLKSLSESNLINNTTYFPLNTIFYGPPGTGKTYNTILRAAEIVETRKIDSYPEALKIFKDNLHNRIEFITFHQNYSYEDFIQGLRPETDNKSSLTFDKKDGVFKIIADKALENLKLSEKDPEELSNEALFDNALEKFKELVEEKEDNYPINESAYIMEVEEDAFRYTGEKWTNHANGLRMKYSDLKEFYKNRVISRKDIKNLSNVSGLAGQHATYYFLVYEKIIKLLPQKIDAPLKVEKKNFVIIIDEINRANISRVFGELITLIEPDKRSHGEIPLEAKLPSGDYFVVPSNLYIIGTMNTTDKSIALLDIALRRRFEFESMYPLYEISDSEMHDKDILLKINEQIIKSKTHDFQIGHAYFMGENNDLVHRMNKKVIPLLLEYFMNDEKEVKGISYNAGLQVEENSWPIKITGKRA